MELAQPELGTLEIARLQKSADALNLEYASASPWPHVVIDDFLPQAVAEHVASAFPKESSTYFKLAFWFGARSYRGSVPHCDPTIQSVLSALEAPEFAKLIEQITGIGGLIADNAHVGSGFQQGARGSHLRIHADHNVHPVNISKYRRVNLLIYTNKSWQNEWNGDLELWDRNAERCVKRISPTFNRCVIFGVDDSAYHGYGPLRMPFGRTRNVLAEYYYSDNPAPGQSVEPHGTKLPRMPGDTVLKRAGYRVRNSMLWRVKKIIETMSSCE